MSKAKAEEIIKWGVDPDFHPLINVIEHWIQNSKLKLWERDFCSINGDDVDTVIVLRWKRKE